MERFISGGLLSGSSGSKRRGEGRRPAVLTLHGADGLTMRGPCIAPVRRPSPPSAAMWRWSTISTVPRNAGRRWLPLQQNFRPYDHPRSTHWVSRRASCGCAGRDRAGPCGGLCRAPCCRRTEPPHAGRDCTLSALPSDGRQSSAGVGPQVTIRLPRTATMATEAACDPIRLRRPHPLWGALFSKAL